MRIFFRINLLLSPPPSTHLQPHCAFILKFPYGSGGEGVGGVVS
jgi:hypothetical protein